MPRSPSPLLLSRSYPGVSEFFEAYRGQGLAVESPALDSKMMIDIGGVRYEVDMYKMKVLVDSDSLVGTACNYPSAARKMFSAEVQRVVQEIQRGFFASAGSSVARRPERLRSVPGSPRTSQQMHFPLQSKADKCSVEGVRPIRKSVSGSAPHTPRRFGSMKLVSIQQRLHRLRFALGSVHSCSDLAAVVRRVEQGDWSKVEEDFNQRLEEILCENFKVWDTAGLYEVCNGLSSEDFTTLTPLLLRQLCQYEAADHVQRMTQPSCVGRGAEADVSDCSLLTEALVQHRVFQDHGGGMYVTDRADYVKAKFTLQGMGKNPPRDLLCKLLGCQPKDLYVDVEEVFTQEIKDILDAAKGQDVEATKVAYNKADLLAQVRMKCDHPGKAAWIDKLGAMVGSISKAIEKLLWQQLGPQNDGTLQASLARQQVALLVGKITATRRTEEGRMVKVKSFADLCRVMQEKQRQCFGFGVSPMQSLELLVGGESEAAATEKSVQLLGQLMPEQDLTDPIVHAQKTTSMKLTLLEELAKKLEQKVNEMASLRKLELAGVGAGSTLLIAKAKGLSRSCQQLAQQLRAESGALS